MRKFYVMLLQVHLCNTTRVLKTAAAFQKGWKERKSDAHVQEKGNASDFLSNQKIQEEIILKHMKTKDLVLCAMFVALIAVGAFIKVSVPVFRLHFSFYLRCWRGCCWVL